MFIWRNEETVEIAALQILNILYSVPQLSVRLAEIPESHRSMIRFWFDYWNTNRSILIDGKFMPSSPTANYPFLTAVKDKDQITTVYEDIVVSVADEIDRLDIVNAKASTSVVIQLEAPFNGALIVKDCKGENVVDKKVKLGIGVHTLKIPKSGIASLIIEQ